MRTQENERGASKATGLVALEILLLRFSKLLQKNTGKVDFLLILEIRNIFLKLSDLLKSVGKNLSPLTK
jgi:hypothetical protein